MSAAELTKVLHREHDRTTTTVNSVRAILHRRVLRGITFVRLADSRFWLLSETNRESVDPRERSEPRHHRAEDEESQVQGGERGASGQSAERKD